MGVTYGFGKYGPDGINGGSQCFYKWEMPSIGQASSYDSARLEAKNPVSSVIPFLKLTKLKTRSSLNTLAATSTPTANVSISTLSSSRLSSATIGAIVGGVLGGLALSALFVIFIVTRKRAVVIADDHRISEISEVENMGYEQPGGRLFPESHHTNIERPSGRTENDGQEFNGRVEEG